VASGNGTIELGYHGKVGKLMLNNGTRYSDIVKKIYPTAYSQRWTTMGSWGYHVWYIMDNKDLDYSTIIGRGKSAWLAWKNASSYIERAMLERLES
jgi:hypothetical protein